MQDTPPVGGDTLWINLYAVYDSLSPTLQDVVSMLDLSLDLGEPFRLAVTAMQGEKEYRRIAAQVPALFEALSGMDIKQLMSNVKAIKSRPETEDKPEAK